jgi:DNA-binding transcriptional regulator YiaG
MTPQEFKALRRAMGLTHVALARQLGVTAHSIASWENSRRRIVRRTEIAMRALALGLPIQASKAA